jgi:hypothetical protein
VRRLGASVSARNRAASRLVFVSPRAVVLRRRPGFGSVSRARVRSTRLLLNCAAVAIFLSERKGSAPPGRVLVFPRNRRRPGFPSYGSPVVAAVGSQVLRLSTS